MTGLSLVAIDRFLFPKLVSNSWLSKQKFFRKLTENVVIVNKTEQVTVSEEQNVSRYSDKSAASIVEILSRKKKAAGSRIFEEAKIGSGFAVTADGLAVTTKGALMAEDAELEVITGDQMKFKASVVFSDSFSDMIVLKLEGAENLSTPPFIAPEDIETGAKIVAIGRSPNNAQIMFKSGLISRLAEDYSLGGAIAPSEKLQGVYFPDFEVGREEGVNFSGSAISDFNGNIVGILGSKKSGSGEQYFIVPVNHVNDLIKRYIEKGPDRMKRGSLGIYYQLITKENSVKLPDGGGIEKGALVYSPSLQQGLAVISGGAAEKAGIRVGDIVLSVGGEEVNSQNNLAYLISKYGPGETVSLEILREGKEMNISAILQ